ncbi:MAG: DUF1566 domain-containing protein [Bacteroidota bacterium]
MKNSDKRINNKYIFLKFYLLLIIIVLMISSGCKKDIKGCTNSKATNYNSKANQDDGSCTYLSIGQIYEGGTIFYIDDSGLHGLIAPSNDQGSGIPWDNGQSLATLASGTGMGTGKSNTNKIVAAQAAGNYAAYMCDTLTLNGYTDWFLPSKDELNQLYQQNLAGVVAGFANDVYWSSSENSNYTAWSLNFAGGFINDEKTTPHCVRAIRAF